METSHGTSVSVLGQFDYICKVGKRLYTCKVPFKSTLTLDSRSLRKSSGESRPDSRLLCLNSPYSVPVRLIKPELPCLVSSSSLSTLYTQDNKIKGLYEPPVEGFCVISLRLGSL